MEGTGGESGEQPSRIRMHSSRKVQGSIKDAERFEGLEDYLKRVATRGGPSRYLYLAEEAENMSGCT